MQDRPLEVHCSGLGGGQLSGEHDYDIFLQNQTQTKVYGPSLAMTDNWEAHVTQLGLTKTVHEYVIYQLLSTAEGWTAWRDFLPEHFSDHQLLLTRAIRLIKAAHIMKVHRFVPSHRTGCVEMMVNSSMNSRGNGRPTLNRFVLDKCHLRMNYDMWFSTFSGSLHSA